MSETNGVQKIDITSSVIEKGIDAAKSFLSKLITPALEETGLLIKDQMSFYRFKNQVRMLNRAKNYIEKNHINPKQISLKLLAPMLDYSGIEEDEVLQDKWAILLSNLVDSEQNIQNHVFPYILSQLSKNEFLVLEGAVVLRLERLNQLNNELQIFKSNKIHILQELEHKKLELIDIHNQLKGNFGSEWYEWRQKQSQNEKDILNLKNEESSILFKIAQPEIISNDNLEEYELSNLIRLGLVKEVKEFFAYSQTLEIPNRDREQNSYTNVDFDIDVDSNTENILTELGILFINACKEKKNIPHTSIQSKEDSSLRSE